jgi:hypothetical protein
MKISTACFILYFCVDYFNLPIVPQAIALDQ